MTESMRVLDSPTLSLKTDIQRLRAYFLQVLAERASKGYTQEERNKSEGRSMSQKQL